MTENSGQWERELVTRLAMAAVREQRRARLWGIFFKLLTFAYLTLVLLLAVDWKGGADVVRGKKHTAMVELNGIIAPGTDASADKVTTALQAAFKDKNTQGVVLRINSPGGSPVQSQTIYDEMRRLRKKYPDIPLYAVVEDICASGGYFVAAGADRIYVSKSSIVGSIGVLMNGFGFTGLMDKLGVEHALVLPGGDQAPLDTELVHTDGGSEAVHQHAERADNARFADVDAVRAGGDEIAAGGADVLDHRVERNVGIFL